MRDVNTSSDAARGSTLAFTSIASVQFGAALAATLFPRVGPLGTVSLRLIGAAVVLQLLTRPWRHRWSRGELGASLLFGAIFTVMNTSLYLALDRLPLGTVITLEFLGPLVIAIWTATSWSTRAWAVPAAAGVLLLGGSLSGGDLLGIVYSLVAAVCWAAYILTSRVVGRGRAGLGGVAVACTVGAVVMLPVGAVAAGSALLHPSTAVLGLAVGVLSSAIPYSLDLLALRRLPTAVFGVLVSANPAVAALAGFLVLGESLAGRALVGIGLVIVASAGVSVSTALRRSAPPEPVVVPVGAVSSQELSTGEVCPQP